MNQKITIREKIFEALITLNEQRVHNPANKMTCVIDRQANFYFYDQLNSLNFWHKKEPKDFIKLSDSESVFLDENKKYQNMADIIDDVKFYEMIIHEHVTFDFPQKPYKLHKIIGKKNKLREPF